jgi:hypothetical protein
LRNPDTRATRSTVREAEACPVKPAASWIGARSGLLTVTGGGGGATKAGLRLQADRPATSAAADNDTSAARIAECRTPPSADACRMIARSYRAAPYAAFLRKLEPIRFNLNGKRELRQSRSGQRPQPSLDFVDRISKCTARRQTRTPSQSATEPA